ncbi:MAG: hypothetical protein E5V42_02115, partial [Mesorhizobium sp.]
MLEILLAARAWPGGRDMMRFSIMVGLVIASSMARAGDNLPYSPSADVPDYVATMTVQPLVGPTHTRIVTHHG